MRVRTKFTAMIACCSMFAAVLFSTIVYEELTEEIYEIIDNELIKVGEKVLKKVSGPLDHTANAKISYDDRPVEDYWVKIYAPGNTVIFASQLSQYTELPLRLNLGTISVKGHIPIEHITIPASEMDELDEISTDDFKFRVRAFSREVAGKQYIIHIAKPVPLLSAEFRELIYDISLEILATVTIILALSYILAGKILNPLKTINRLIKDIRENSLNKRIPLGKNKDELYTLSTSLNEMFDRLQYSFQQQKELVSNASHEMKSPLTILMLSNEEILSTTSIEKIHEEHRKQLRTLQRLNKLVRDLLDISRLEHQHKLLRQPVSLNTIVQGVLEDFSYLIKRRKIVASTEMEDLTVSGDRDQLHRVFINLIDNAIKYNRVAGGQITIRGRRTGSRHSVEIANTGKTIPPEDLPHIFNQFYRVEKSRSRAYGGTGLGLTIARKIIEMHDGSMEVSSADCLTTFTLTLPQ